MAESSRAESRKKGCEKAVGKIKATKRLGRLHPFDCLQTFSGTLDRSLRQKANSAIRTLDSQLATKANEGIEDRGMFSVFGQKRKKEPRDAKVRARFCGVRDYLYPRTAEEKMKKK